MSGTVRLVSRSAALIVAFVLGLTSISRADIAPRWSDSALVRSSELILTGRVVRVASGWDREIDGIYTYVTIDVSDVLKGWIPESQITLKQLGGTVDDLTFSVPGQPSFTGGQTVLLFLEVRPRDHTLYTAAMWQGKWDVVVDASTGQQLASRVAPIENGQASASLRDIRFLSTFATRLRALSDRATGLRPSRPIQVRPPETPIGAGASSGSASAAFALLGPARWNEADTAASIPVDVQKGGNPLLSGGGVTQIANSRAMWNAGGSMFRFGAGSSGTARCFNSLNDDHRVSLTFNDPCGEIQDDGGILAIGGGAFTTTAGKVVNGTTFMRFTGGGVVYNNSSSAQLYMSTPGCFQDTTTHELGHTLGLGHSARTAAIMYPIISGSCFTGPRGLGADDKAGIQFIYPLPVACSAPGVPVNMKVTRNGNTITLSWSALAPGAVPTSYLLQAGSSSGASNLYDAGVGNQTMLRGPLPTGTYFFRVKARNACGASAVSNQVKVVVP